MADRLAELQAAALASMANGWERCPGKPNTLRRSVEHATPEGTPESWWRLEWYYSVEFLTFTFSDRNRVPKVVYGYSRCPWFARADRSVSFKKSLELLAQPITDSPVHN